MEWVDVESSSLMDLVTAGDLKHPTNAAFSAEAWRDAALRLPRLGRRDSMLTMGAIVYGQRLQAVRRDIAETPLGPTRADAIRLLAACANQQALTVFDSAMAEAATQIAAAEEPHFEMVGQSLLEGASGQRFSANDLNTIVVDALPHWLHRIGQLPPVSTSPRADEPAAGAAASFMAASLESGIRSLWHGVIWLGHEIQQDGDAYLDTPGDRRLAELWFIWDLRQGALANAATHMDAGAAIVARGRLAPITPVTARTVVGLAPANGGLGRFVVGATSTTSREQRSHASERDTLEKLYTGQFLDEPLPHPAGLGLTCRELNAAWCVLTDLARLLLPELGREVWTETEVGQLSLPVEVTELARALGDALGVSDDRARAILALLTCAPANTKTLFSRGVWATPLLPAPGSDQCYILLAPLLFGSPVRRIEAFMVRGGISDDRGVKGRGKPFEAHARRALAAAMETNPVLSGAVVYPAALGRKKQGEEIDLLVRIGSTVIVGEIKCFVAPSEALERYNYLRNLSDAARQARNKLEWTRDNRAEIAALLGVNDASDIASLAFQPVVVLNQGFGTGLSRFGVPIVDLAYLKLLLGSDHYQGRTRFERDVGMTYATVPLYADQADLEARLADRLENPVVLKRFEGAVGWRHEPFAWDDIKIALPTLLRAPDGDEAVDSFDGMDVPT